jgi:hypothetical protein
MRFPTVPGTMSISCRGYGIRVSGLGDDWFVGPEPVVQGHFFDDYTADDLVWMGGESQVTETAGPTPIRWRETRRRRWRC